MSEVEVRPTLTFRGGGWVIALTFLLVGALLTWALWGVMRGEHPIGDGRNVPSYGFQLDPMKADAEYLVGSGQPRDFLPSLDDPSVMRGDGMLEFNTSQKRVYVTTTDRVAGVVVNGAARAYPLSVLNAHEVVNDTLGGVPIAVTYSPLTDSVVAFDRRIDGADQPPRLFKVSGLLYNSNLVMYDVMPGEDTSASDSQDTKHVPSLWSQLEMRAIAGPGAAQDKVLKPLPGVNIASWKMWLTAHPETSVIMQNPQFKQRYKEMSYARYNLSPHVSYPVRNLPPEARESQTVKDALEAFERGDQPTRKTATVVVTAGKAGDASASETAVWTLPELLSKTGGQDGVWSTTLGGVPLLVVVQREPMAVMVTAPGGERITVVPQLWFARCANP